MTTDTPIHDALALETFRAQLDALPEVDEVAS